MHTRIKVLFISIMLAIIGSVSAAETGLLLGLRYGANYDVNANLPNQKSFDGPHNPSYYRTFWIRAEDGQVKLAAEKTNLLVPRDDGFWRVDVKHSKYNDFKEDLVWINPAPDPDALPNPFLAEQEGIDAFDSSLLVKEQGIQPTLGEYCKGQTARDILFIGADYFSVGYVRSETCGFMGGSADSALQMLSLAELELVDVANFLAEEDHATFQASAKNYQERHSDIEDWGDVSGGIVRHQGQWIIKGHFPIIDSGYTHFDMAIAAPNSLVGPNVLYPDWKKIKELLPDAIDAFSSPAKDLLVVLTESASLFAFTVDGDKISEQPVLHIIFKHPVTPVMVRWAEGLNVWNWTEEMQNLGPKPQETWFTEAEITEVKEEPKMIGIVVSDNTTLNIRQGVGQHTKPIAKVKTGSKVNIADILGQWYKLELEDGRTGYAHSDYVKILPKLPYIQVACPVENCRYGQWTLKKPITLYVDPSFKSDAVGILKANQQIQARYGEIQTIQFGEIEVTKAQELADDNQTLTLQTGDRLFDLESVGLGIHLMWYNGGLYYLNNGWDSNVATEEALWGTPMTKRKTDWWVKVEVPEENLSGWIANPDADGISD